MIDRSRLRDLHGDDLPLHVLEQDYVQALFLQELYRESEQLVFKGGTFLKHAHGLDRFSEDLDFTSEPDVPVLAALESAANGLDRYGLPATIDALERRTNAVIGRLEYEGPLYDGTARSRGHIELDVSTRGDVFREPEWVRLFVPYPETRAITARCLVLEEAFAEKLRALSTRSRGRDLYDCWFLLGEGVTLEAELFEQKMGVIGREPRVTISVSEREYERDLSVLVTHPPEYGTVLEAITDALAEIGVPVSVETSP